MSSIWITIHGNDRVFSSRIAYNMWKRGDNARGPAGLNYEKFMRMWCFQYLLDLPDVKALMIAGWQDEGLGND